jgi:hypothetical protein
MKEYLNILVRITSLAILWASGGYMIGLALEAIGFTGYPFPVIIASLNVIFGMIFFRSMISYRFVDEAFFEGAKPNEPGYLIVGWLWMLPTLSVIVGTSMWFWAIILRLLMRE